MIGVKRCFSQLVMYFLIVASWPIAVFGSDLDNNRVKISCLWNGQTLDAYKVKMRFSRKNPKYGLVSGHIDVLLLENNRLQIGPYQIAWNKLTQFKTLEAVDLVVGNTVKVAVHLNDEGDLIADRFEPGPSDLKKNEIQMIGNLNVLRTLPDGTVKAMILGQELNIPERFTNLSLRLTRRQDDRRPEDQLSLELFDRQLVIGGEIGMTPRFRKDLRLDRRRDDDRLRVDLSFQLELFYRLSRNLFVFTEMSGDSDRELYREGGADHTFSRRLQRGETWLFWGNINDSGFSFQVGRQNFQDAREWWWDENIDSVRLYYNQPFFHSETAVGQRMAVDNTGESRIDPNEKKVLKVIHYTNWQWAAKQSLSVFFFHRHDLSGKGQIDDLLKESRLDFADSRLTWFGLRSLGYLDFDDFGETDYWIDTAFVTGKETGYDFDEVDENLLRVESVSRRHIQGWAIDTGITWETGLPMQPSLTFGYAFGSKEFRQTGLHDNNNRFNGVDRFRYYGELFRPELSNLHIWTASVGLPLLKNSSLEFLYHYYHQVNEQAFIRDSRISADLTGTSGSIGHEWDMVIGLEEWQHLELEFVAAMFRSGSAYGELSGNYAFNVLLKANYNF
ncbi:MAG: alginate export family protein [Gammaproteobacteria bacterium]|nr:alginate export family protein [Gammaproteobacteria bacterium]